MAEGRAKFATVQRSDDGLSVGVRLRVALDILETLGEAGVALAPRSPKTKLRLGKIAVDEEGQSHVEGTGDTTGTAQLIWEIIAGKEATWSGMATDDDLPDDVPGSVLDVLGGLLGEKGKAGDLGEKLEEASRGFVDTHDDVRSAIASWRDANPDEDEAPAAPAPAPKAAEQPPKPASPAQAAPAAPPKAPLPAPAASAKAPDTSGADPTAWNVSRPTNVATQGAPVAEKPKEPTPKPAPVAATPDPPAAAARKPFIARLPSELPDAWDAPPLSAKLDAVLDQGELPPPESVAPLAPYAEAPAVAVPYPPVPAAPRAANFPDEEDAVEPKKPGRVAPPDPSAPPPPPSPMPMPMPLAPVAADAPAFPAPKRAPQPTVPETKAARSFVDTVPPGPDNAPHQLGDDRTDPRSRSVDADLARQAPPVPRGALPRAPQKTDPLRTLPKPPAPNLASLKKTEPMRPRPEPAAVREALGANGAAQVVSDLVDNGAADPKARSVHVIESDPPPPPHAVSVSTPKPAEVSKPPSPPRKTVPDLRRPPPQETLTAPLADAAALAIDGAIPLPLQAPAPITPTAKVILEGPDRMRAQMQTVYTRKDQEPVLIAPAAPPPPQSAPEFSIPAPPRKSKATIVAVVVVAAVGIGIFGYLASQIQGAPELTPTPTVTAPAPSETTGAAAPPTAEPAPTAVATAEAAPTPTPKETAEPAPTAVPTSTGRASGSHTAAPKGTGSRGSKKWQPNLPDRL